MSLLLISGERRRDLDAAVRVEYLEKPAVILVNEAVAGRVFIDRDGEQQTNLVVAVIGQTLTVGDQHQEEIEKQLMVWPSATQKPARGKRCSMAAKLL
jgi:hypothetical protein